MPQPVTLNKLKLNGSILRHTRSFRTNTKKDVLFIIGDWNAKAGSQVTPGVCWWTSRLFPCPGYYKQCCDEHWGTCVSFNSGFLSVYAQQWDWWVIRQFCLQWIRKLWYIYTMEYYSAIKKNTFESVQMRWMKLEPIIQSEVSQKEKHQYSILTHIYGI